MTISYLRIEINVLILNLTHFSMEYRVKSARQLLAVALAHREIQRTREQIREKLFIRNVHFANRTFLLGLVMVLLSEINILWATTLFLLAILIGLSFWLIVESWNCCEKVTLKLTQEHLRMMIN